LIGSKVTVELVELVLLVLSVRVCACLWLMELKISGPIDTTGGDER
jgi:hypothetical protein